MPGEIVLACGAVALVDLADLPLLSQYKWHRLQHRRTTYARSSMKVDGEFQTVLMHRFLLRADGNTQVDHRNGNGLDNQRLNLRLATTQENNRNKSGRGQSGFTGVKRSGGKWMATISPDGHEIFLGAYECPEIAAAVYNSAAKTVYGQFAHINPVGFAADLLAEVIAGKQYRADTLLAEIALLKGGK